MERLEDYFIDDLMRNNSLVELQKMLEQNPSDYLINAAIGRYHLTSDSDVKSAVEAYREILKNPKSPQFYRRQFGFVLAKNPDYQENAYQLLKKIYINVPAIFRGKDVIELSNIENHLNIPSNERVTKIDRYTKD